MTQNQQPETEKEPLINILIIKDKVSWCSYQLITK